MTVNEFLKRWIMHYVHPEYFYIPWNDNTRRVTFKFTLTDNPIPTDKYTVDCEVSFYLYNKTTGKFMTATRDGDIYRVKDRNYSNYESGTVVTEYPCITARNEVTVVFPKGEFRLIEYSCTRGVLKTTHVDFVPANQDIVIPHKVAYSKTYLDDSWLKYSTQTTLTNETVVGTTTEGGYGNMSFTERSSGEHCNYSPITTYLAHVTPVEENTVDITYTMQISPYFSENTSTVRYNDVSGYTHDTNIRYTPRNDEYSNDKTVHDEGLGLCPWSIKTATITQYSATSKTIDTGNSIITILLNGQSYGWNDKSRRQPTNYDINGHFSGISYSTMCYNNQPAAWQYTTFNTSLGGELGLPNVGAVLPSADPEHFIGHNPTAEQLWYDMGGHSIFGNGYVGTYANDDFQTIHQSGTLRTQYSPSVSSILNEDDGYVTITSTIKTDDIVSKSYTQHYGWTMEVAYDYDSVYTIINSYWVLQPFGASEIVYEETVVQESETQVDVTKGYFNTWAALEGVSVMFFRFFNRGRGSFVKNGIVSDLVNRVNDNRIGYENSLYDCTRFDEAVIGSDTYWEDLFHLKDVSYNIFLFQQHLENYLTYTVP